MRFPPKILKLYLEQRKLGRRGQGNRGTGEHGNIETGEQGNRRTGEQGNKGTEEQGNKGTGYACGADERTDVRSRDY